MVTRRSALRLVAAGTGLTVLAACQPAAPAPAAPSPAATVSAPPAPAAATAPPPSPAAVAAPAAPQPKSGGTLRAGQQTDVSSLDGHTLQGQDYNTKWAVYDRLIS